MKLDIEEIELLINKKGHDSIFEAKQNFLKFDVYYLALKEQSKITNSGTYFCDECKTYHFNKDSKKLDQLKQKFLKLNNENTFINF